MSEVSLSYIVPIYRKSAQTVERCVKSICESSLKDWDAVFVLDGPDPLAADAIHRAMKRRPNKYKVVEIEHAGACAARNAGLPHAQGRYVIFLDADIVLEPHIAKAWVEKLDEKPELGWVYSHYKFNDARSAIHAEPFDPWLLRVRNYISGCFPVRRSILSEKPWNESLLSLQDWDYWLTLVDAGHKGKMLDTYSWTTELPNKDSISGQGTTDAVWLERVRAVQKIHNLPERKVCVSSLGSKYDGIALAKAIDADYQDYPNGKPHTYDTIIQVGFNMDPSRVEAHAAIFSEPSVKKFLFWTPDDINQVYNGCSFQSLVKYSELLNAVCVKQFVEDEAARKMMEKAGFKVEVLPLPLHTEREPKPLPEKARFLVETCGEYNLVFKSLTRSLPDVELIPIGDAANIEDYTGLLHFYLDRTTSPAIKRALLSGRHVISNVQAPFAGFVDDMRKADQFLPAMVDKIRKAASKPLNSAGRDYWLKAATAQKVKEVIGA